ncbi:hypothetical protein Esti_002150 [Eimeria stiedai]
MEGSSLQGFWFEDEVRLPPPPRVLPSRNGAFTRVGEADGVGGGLLGAPTFDSAALAAAYQSQHTLQHYLSGANSLSAPSLPQSPLPLLQQQTSMAEAAAAGGNGSRGLDGSEGIKASFGCHTEETNLFLTQRASGIWGLEVLNSFGPPTFPYSVLLQDLHLPHLTSSSSNSSGARPAHHVPPSAHAQRFIHNGAAAAVLRGAESSRTSPYRQSAEEGAGGAPLPGGGPGEEQQPQGGTGSTLSGQRVFSICLAEHGGALTFGGAHEEFQLQPPKWTPIIGMQDSYNVRLAALRVGGLLVPLLPHQDMQVAGSVAAKAEAQAAAMRGAFPVSSAWSGAAPPLFPTPSSNPFYAAGSGMWGRAETSLGPGGLRANETLTVLIDSGSTLAYFPRALYRRVVGAIEQYLKSQERGLFSRRLNEVEKKKKRGISSEGKGGQEDEGTGGSAAKGRLERPLMQEPVEVVAANPAATAAAAAAGDEQQHGAEGEGSEEAVPRSLQRQQQQQLRTRLLSDLFSSSSQGDQWTGEGIIVSNSNRGAAVDALEPPEAADTLHSLSSLFSVRRAPPARTTLGSISAYGGGPHQAAEPERRPRVMQQQQEVLLRAATAAAAAVASEVNAAASSTPLVTASSQPRLPTGAAAAGGEGSEVADVEALPVLVALSSVPEEEYNAEAAYELLPRSAPPRKSQAVKIDASAGEICYFLPRGRKDLVEFPLIELLFAPAPTPFPLKKNSSSSGGDGQWVVWEPRAYLYGKGNEHYRCLALSEDSSGTDSAVLGSSFFIGKDVIIHVTAETMGFAQANYRQRLSEEEAAEAEGLPNSTQTSLSALFSSPHKTYNTHLVPHAHTRACTAPIRAGQVEQQLLQQQQQQQQHLLSIEQQDQQAPQAAAATMAAKPAASSKISRVPAAALAVPAVAAALAAAGAALAK